MIKSNFPEWPLFVRVAQGESSPVGTKNLWNLVMWLHLQQPWVAGQVGGLGKEVKNKAHVIHNGLVHEFGYDRKSNYRNKPVPNLGRPKRRPYSLCAAYGRGRTMPNSWKYLKVWKAIGHFGWLGRQMEKAVFQNL